MFAAILMKNLMKKIFVCLASVLWASLVFGQSQDVAPGDSIPWELRKQSLIYNAALKFNDPAVAKMALYNLIAEDPGNHILYDSLAKLYREYKQPISAALVAQQAININPNDMFAMEIAASSFDQLGAKDKALSYYAKLYLNGSDNWGQGVIHVKSVNDLRHSRNHGYDDRSGAANRSVSLSMSGLARAKSFACSMNSSASCPSVSRSTISG